MMKRLLDIILSGMGLLVLSPIIGIILLLVWAQDRHSPFYVAPRAGRGLKTFEMVKIRSMVVGADRCGVESTGAGDNRITPLGHFIRRWKIDEISQLWNVFVGDMSIVGPRPNTVREVADYTAVERGLLKVRPGITDFSSIVFSDEGDIIKDAADPDQAYRELIRPWKSRLGLVYIAHASVILDLKLILLTIVAIADKQKALHSVCRILEALNAEDTLINICARRHPLTPATLP